MERPIVNRPLQVSRRRVNEHSLLIVFVKAGPVGFERLAAVFLHGCKAKGRRTASENAHTHIHRPNQEKTLTNCGCSL